ncbi:MAG: pilus assembly protein N-terminal domain-containing protein [Proteobacteria bacterium]|nr:pilus assembly protein N-terminal domain-containing protein [Pseudomonadota bacterium]
MRALRLAVLTVIALLIGPAIAFAENPAPRHPVKHAAFADGGLTVPMDEAKMITFTQPITTLFIGNPAIADVTAIDSHHAYLLGKTFGVTNMIGLDGNNHQVMNAQINVTNRMMGAVTLNRGAETYNYSCTRLHCETNPRPGDPTSYVSTTEGTAQQHEANAKAAVASSQ